MNQGRVRELKDQYLSALLLTIRELSAVGEKSAERREAVRQVEEVLVAAMSSAPGRQHSPPKRPN